MQGDERGLARDVIDARPHSAQSRKIGITPEFGWRLVSVYGHGYRLEKLKE